MASDLAHASPMKPVKAGFGSAPVSASPMSRRPPSAHDAQARAAAHGSPGCDASASSGAAPTSFPNAALRPAAGTEQMDLFSVCIPARCYGPAIARRNGSTKRLKIEDLKIKTPPEGND